MNRETLLRHWPIMLVALFSLASVPTALAGIPVGACCVNGVCDDAAGLGIAQVECETTLGGVYQGDASTCQTVTCGAAVPAASTWGLAAMALLLLTAGTLVFRRRMLQAHHIAYLPPRRQS